MTDAKPRVRFRDYYCKTCSRMLARANIDTVVFSMPPNLKDTHPLLYVAIKSLTVDFRCPRCKSILTIKPDFGTNGNSSSEPVLSLERKENTL